MRYLLIFSFVVAGWLSACSRDVVKLSAVQTSGQHRLKAKTHNYAADKSGVFAGRYTVVALPAGCWLDADGKPATGKVTVTLLEAYNRADFVKAGLNTRSGQRLLESNGMFRLTASQNGKPLRINPDAGVYVSFFTPEKDKDMQLFTGDSTDGTVDWKLTAEKEQTYAYDQRKCDRCEKLVKLVKKFRPGKLKPDEEDPWRAMRYYWRNGTLCYFGSGVIDTIATLQELKACDAMLDNCANGASLKKEIDALKKEIADREKVDSARMKFHFYEYKLNTAGWHNFDKYTKDEAADLITMEGTLQDAEGNPIEGPGVVHLVGTDARLHLQVQTTNGSFEFKYLKGRPYRLLAFAGPNLAATLDGKDKANMLLKVSEKTEDEMAALIEKM